MSKIRRYLGKNPGKTIIQSTDSGFVENMNSLYSILETLISTTDGIKPHVKRIRFFIRAHVSTSDAPFLGQLVVVQTNGTFTDSVNLSGREISTILDSAIDDDFGFQFIGEPKVSVVKNVSDDGGLELHYLYEVQVDIPQNLINLLNKETHTERLQDLYMALVGVTSGTSDVILLKHFYIVDYVETRKSITIR